MLDKFLEVVSSQTKEAAAFDTLVEDFTQLPNEELYRLANGTSKLAYGEHDGEWLEKFEGTELYAQALELEEQCLNIDIADKQHRLAEDERREAEQANTPERPDFYKQRDAISLKKRILDLEFTKQKLRKGGDGEEEGEEEELPEAMSPSEGAGEPNPLEELKEAMARPVQAKTAAIAPEVVASMRKEALGAALMAAGKGIGQFAGRAGKSVANAAKTRGAKGALDTAGASARVGARQAGQFAIKNPGMAAGIGAGTLGAAALAGRASGS